MPFIFVTTAPSTLPPTPPTPCGGAPSGGAQSARTSTAPTARTPTLLALRLCHAGTTSASTATRAKSTRLHRAAPLCEVWQPPSKLSTTTQNTCTRVFLPSRMSCWPISSKIYARSPPNPYRHASSTVRYGAAVNAGATKTKTTVTTTCKMLEAIASNVNHLFCKSSKRSDEFMDFAKKNHPDRFKFRWWSRMQSLIVMCMKKWEMAKQVLTKLKSYKQMT